jgi:hypothetical protein
MVTGLHHLWLPSLASDSHGLGAAAVTMKPGRSCSQLKSNVDRLKGEE